MKRSAKIIIRGLIALFLIIVFVSIMLFLFWKIGVFNEITSIREFSNSVYGYLLYAATYLITMLLVFIPLVPMIIAMTTISPPLVVVALSFMGNVAGAVILYLVGRYGAKNLIMWVAQDEEILEKWQKVMYRGKYTIFLMILFPFSPNQLIMVLCGAGKMKMKFYLPIITFGQLAGIFTLVYFTRSLSFLEPLWFWLPLMFTSLVLLMYLSFRHQGKIDWFFKKITGRIIKRSDSTNGIDIIRETSFTEGGNFINENEK